MPEMKTIRVPADIHAMVKQSADEHGRTWISELRWLLFEKEDRVTDPDLRRSSGNLNRSEVEPMWKKPKKS